MKTFEYNFEDRVNTERSLCVLLKMNRVNAERSDSIIIPGNKVIRVLEEEDLYKYRGIHLVDEIAFQEMKGKIQS